MQDQIHCAGKHYQTEIQLFDLLYVLRLQKSEKHCAKTRFADNSDLPEILTTGFFIMLIRSHISYKWLIKASSFIWMNPNHTFFFFKSMHFFSNCTPEFKVHLLVTIRQWELCRWFLQNWYINRAIKLNLDCQQPLMNHITCFFF